MGIFTLLAGASIAATQPHAPAPAIRPAARVECPALWVVNDHDTIIYLFGTFHALDSEAVWFDQAVKTAFFASEELMLETLVPKPPALPGVSGHGTARTLPGASAPSPVAELAPSANYLATTKLVMSAGRRKGLSTDHGADAVLREVADATGKRVGGLESFEFQLRMFSSLPPSRHATPDPRTMEALSGVLAELKSAWSRGDIDRFAPLLRQMQMQSPQTYRTMFVERNARWAHWIADRLKSPGTVFVAVGAGHLSGPDSVQNQLASIGVKSARVN